MSKSDGQPDPLCGCREGGGGQVISSCQTAMEERLDNTVYFAISPAWHLALRSSGNGIPKAGHALQGYRCSEMFREHIKSNNGMRSKEPNPGKTEMGHLSTISVIELV